MQRRIVDLLAPFGFLLAIGAYSASRVDKLPGELSWYLIGASFLVVLHVILRLAQLQAALSIGERQIKYGANALVMVLAVLSILAGLNYVANRHTLRFDVTKNQRFSLSEQTRKVVSGLEQDIKILYFQREPESSAVAQDRLREYQVLSSRIQLEYVDPWKKPALAREYEVTSVPTLVFESGAKRERITTDSEQDLTNAIIKMTRDEQKVVCFAEGEGQRDPDDSGDAGYSGIRTALTKSQYEVKKILLARERQVPAECTVMVVAGTRNDLLAETVEAVATFVEGGGKALVMADAEIDGLQPGITGLVGRFGVEAGHDVVVDVSGMGQLFGTGPITPIAMDYPSHEITRDMRGVMTALHTARSMQPTELRPKGHTAQALLQTSANSWAEGDLALAEPIQADATDRQGPIPLAVAVTVKQDEEPAAEEPAAEGDAAEKPEDAAAIDAAEDEVPTPEGRFVAVGDSDFASNSLLAFQGNQDLFLNIVAWLAEDADLISIRPKDPEDQRLVLTQGQQELAAKLVPASGPLLFVVLGIVAWWRRR